MIPTALTPRELTLLMRLSERRTVYEAGALLGASTVALASRSLSVRSVDPHVGYPDRAPRPTWRPFLRNLSLMGVLDRVSPIRSRFQDSPPDGEQLAFADLTGCGKLMHQFLECASESPIIAVHDYQLGGCGSSTDAVDAFLRRNSHYRVVREDTLVVMERKA